MLPDEDQIEHPDDWMVPIDLTEFSDEEIDEGLVISQS